MSEDYGFWRWLAYEYSHEWPVSTRVLMPIWLLIAPGALIVITVFHLVPLHSTLVDVIRYGAIAALLLNFFLAGVSDK